MPRMRSITLLTAIALTVAFAGCGDSQEKSGDVTIAVADQNPVPTAKTGKNDVVSTVPIQVYTGAAGSGAVSKSSAYVARSEAQLKSTLTKLGAESASGSISVPNFDSAQLVFVAIPSTQLGTQMTISNVTPKSESKFAVEAVVLPVGAGCKKSSERSSLFTVVQTAKLTGSPSLKLEKRRQSPCT